MRPWLYSYQADNILATVERQVESARRACVDGRERLPLAVGLGSLSTHFFALEIQLDAPAT